MAEVPNLFEDLKSCYSENEEYASAIDRFSLNQKSFYDTSYGPLDENCMNKSVSLSTLQTSEVSELSFKENLVVVSTSAHRKVLKKRRLSLNQTITNEDLEAIINGPEEEIIKPRSAPHIFQSNVKYKYMRILRKEFVLNDSIHQSVTLDATGQYLKAVALTDLSHEVKFDMGGYISATDDNTNPVTLRISKTRLFVSAQEEDQPVLLKEMPETPKIITGNELNLLFLWENERGHNFFRSAANSELLIATKEDSLVHMARGSSSMTDFQIS
ncbi:interleukin-1 alpha [Fukomys damarensis]|uniref:Interleukin-1 n=1 Tax=Fukomys damarensis TaxID=885580 RepID=A0A091D913_FUKDA|nr:interleukin-1 alpha [Fukomys damarensis]KFO26705.1 Interleukin-1 alpha [Fukomys damarensis]